MTAPTSATASLEAVEAVDVNIATCEQLLALELPGLDERRARAIALYRDLHRPFGELDELSRVFGVTDAHVDRWRGRLRVSPPVTQETVAH
jgi:DNA uptake protein ComE-like DNA-binding protein